MSYILQTEHIQKRYSGTTVLADVSIHVEQGEIYGLVGRNGAGKTTLLRIITGQIPDYTGQVILGAPNCPAPKIGVVINDPSLFLNLDATSNLKQHALLLGQKVNGRVEEVLDIVGLDSVGKKPVKHFSLGMKQRLKLATALLPNPDILILDEPINGLDPDGIAELRSLLQTLNRTHGTTILISSHILNELEQTATKFGILHDGTVDETQASEIASDGKNLEAIYLQLTRKAV